MAKSNGRMTTDNAAAVRKEFARLAKRLTKFDVPARESRRERGLRKLTEIVGVRGGRVLNDLVGFSPELTRLIVDFAYGDVISQTRLDERTRALVVVAALAAMGNAEPELKTHIGTALNSGCTREDILETMLLVSLYAGFPAAMNGMVIAREVMRERASRQTPRTRKVRKSRAAPRAARK